MCQSVTPNVVGNVQEEDATGSEHPIALAPDSPVLLLVRPSPLLLAGVLRVEWSPEQMPVGNAAAPVAGVMVVGHSVSVGGRRGNRVERTIRERKVFGVGGNRRPATLLSPLGLYFIGDGCRCYRVDQSDPRTGIKDTPVGCKLRPENRENGLTELGRVSWREYEPGDLIGIGHLRIHPSFVGVDGLDTIGMQIPVEVVAGEAELTTNPRMGDAPLLDGSIDEVQVAAQVLRSLASIELVVEGCARTRPRRGVGCSSLLGGHETSPLGVLHEGAIRKGGAPLLPSERRLYVLRRFGWP